MSQARGRVRPVALVSTMTPEEVAAVGALDLRYKDDWAAWRAVLPDPPVLTSDAVGKSGRVLRKWQAMRAKVKGRRVRDT